MHEYWKTVTTIEELAVNLAANGGGSEALLADCKDVICRAVEIELHRLQSELSEARAEIERITIERNKSEQTALLHCQNSEHWLKKINEVICAPSENNTGSMG